MTKVAPQSPVDILSASWRDLGALRSLETVCFPVDAWPLLDLIGVLSLPNVVRLKAVVQDQMVGFVAGDIHRNEDMAWIATIGVRPDFQRQGIASLLLQACEDRLNVSRVRLSVRVANKPAIRLYEGFGYRQVGTWSSYYQDGSNAIVFEKNMRIAL